MILASKKGPFYIDVTEIEGIEDVYINYKVYMVCQELTSWW